MWVYTFHSYFQLVKHGEEIARLRAFVDSASTLLNAKLQNQREQDEAAKQSMFFELEEASLQACALEALNLRFSVM